MNLPFQVFGPFAICPWQTDWQFARTAQGEGYFCDYPQVPSQTFVWQTPHLIVQPVRLKRHDISCYGNVLVVYWADEDPRPPLALVNLFMAIELCHLLRRVVSQRPWPMIPWAG